MTTSPKTLALRYRIWCFATAREWNVSVTDIATAIEENAQRVSSTMQAAGWLGRVRAPTRNPTPGSRIDGSVGGHIASGRAVIADVLAGRVNSEFTA